MEDDIKIKYKNLLYNVNGINYRINILCEKVDSLNEYLVDNILIDNKIIGKDNYDLVVNKLNAVSNDLNYTVIPCIKRNI